MLVLTEKGLYCPAGHFYIDPSKRVEHAVITHAHADHARKGSQHYYCTVSGLGLLKARLGSAIQATPFPYRQPFFLNGVEITFFPAGHILGSAQVRIRHQGSTWVVSGDYKREPDSSCEPFEVVPCDVFITEATFGTPTFRWPKQDVSEEILTWWQNNKRMQHNSVIVAYSLGKTQRLLSMLSKLTNETIYCDVTSKALNECYRKEGVILANTQCLSDTTADQVEPGALFIVTNSFFTSPRVSLLGAHYRTAFASGWMKNRHFGYDKGFILSDHADWDDLIATVMQTQAKKVYVQHRGKGALVRYLNAIGIEAHADSMLAEQQLSLF